MIKQILDRRLELWVPSYLTESIGRLRQRRISEDGLKHIVFVICDHFEPRHGATSEAQVKSRLAAWKAGYASLQATCHASYGTKPLHTWFYPPHHGIENLAALSEMVFDGLGEVELHYHHQDDTIDTLRNDLLSTICNYQRWGFLMNTGATTKTSFGFIHGDWALNNSCDGAYCGVNDETQLLSELGCWADFTMPSANRCQTRKINSIYYGQSSAAYPKGHDTGRDSRVGQTDTSGLMMIQGPLGINWRAPKYPRIENANLTTENWGRPDRIRMWVDSNIHVKGRPDWLFIKLHTHGAIERDFDALFGEKALAMHRTLNENYNDGKRYRLHYATARQAYNIAKAAEHGMRQDPAAYYDFVVTPQLHSLYSLNAEHTVCACAPDHLKIEGISPSIKTKLHTRVGFSATFAGNFTSIEIDANGGYVELGGEGACQVSLQITSDALAILPNDPGGACRVTRQGVDIWAFNFEDRARLSWQQKSEATSK